MALDAEHEATVDRLEAFHQLAFRAGRPGARDEARGKVGRPNRLVVVRVDGGRTGPRVGRRQDPGQPAAGNEPERVLLRGTVAPAGTDMSVDVLEECSAAEHVDRLEPAANAQDRD